ncbi:MAG: hypothetical protein IJU48_00110 [Synergistaceae bacterium]|nr:hypothetical protein [Synergistaceae bacterium]
MMGGNFGTGKFITKQVYGVAKGAYEAYKAPEGEKASAFQKGYKEATESNEGKIADLIVGIIAK